jgi:hypothetical protein
MFVVLHIVKDHQSKHACNTCVKPFLYMSMWTKILQNDISKNNVSFPFLPLVLVLFEL